MEEKEKKQRRRRRRRKLHTLLTSHDIYAGEKSRLER
jgi:hypothetical protein